MNLQSIMKKNPHIGEQRSKIIVNVRVNHLHFFVNDFFLKNSYYCVYFEGHKRNKVKTSTLIKSLESLTNEKGLKVDGSISCTVTMFQDEIHRKYMNNRLKAKWKRIIIRQMTKLRSGEILYRDVGYVYLPVHKIIQEPDLFDTRLVMTHPANAIDAFIDVTIDAKVDGFMSSMPTSLDTPRSVLKSVQSGFNLIGLGSPIVKNRFISIESQYFGPSPAKPTFLDLNALSRSGKINNFSLESIPVEQTTPLTDNNVSFFFGSFWSRKNKSYYTKSGKGKDGDKDRDDDDGVVVLESPKKVVHFALKQPSDIITSSSDNTMEHPTRQISTASSLTMGSEFDDSSGFGVRDDDCDDSVDDQDGTEDEAEESCGFQSVLKRKGTAMIRREFSEAFTDEDNDDGGTLIEKEAREEEVKKCESIDVHDASFGNQASD